MRICALLFLFLAFSAWGYEPQKVGAGMMFGNPTGVNAKYWLGDVRAIDAGLGLSFGRKSELSLHGDYLFHEKGALFYNDIHPLDLYYGIGGRMEFSDGLEIGVRVPVGISHMIEDRNADVFGEIAPIIDFISKVGLEFHFLIGARYYF